MIPVKLNDLGNAIAAEGANPVIPGIEILKGSGDNQSTRDLQKSTGLSLLSYTGLGAFQKDKLVGWLSEEESKGYHYLINRIKTTAESLSLDKGVTVALTVEKAKASVKAKLVEERPEISVQIELKSILTGLQGTYDLLKPEKIAFMEKELEHKMKRICTDAVKKAQTELKSDLFGFGEAVHRKYPGYWKTAKYTWDRDFPEVPIKIKVKARIINTGSITKSLFDKKKD
jgi:spore germination protein KC